MNILLVSECSKNALTETRRILDHFAERRGERTWQTSITLDGLNALRKLLRKTARKNTAVACHWIRGKDHSELLWIVGDAHRFNAEGAVPTNFTQQDILRNGDENDWHTGEDIRLIAQLAALIHDLGKASTAFQDRLRRFLNGQQTQKNLYRHEWVSLRLFQAFVGDDDDEVWLTRLADENSNYEALWTTAGRYMRDGLDAKNEDRYPFRKLASQAPLAAAIAWLVVTHHRLPAKPVIDDGTRKQKRIGSEVKSLALTEIPDPLTKVAHDWNEVIQDVTPAQVRPYWDMSKDIPLASPLWKKQAAKVAKQLLARHNRRRENWLDNPYVMHLARLCLMLADHHYSSLGLNEEDKPVAERLNIQCNSTLAANTTRNRHGRPVLNQSLLEHLLGVAQGTAAIARGLPGFERYLPRLASHRGLRKRSGNPRFAWQDKAFDAATAIREQARQQGAFIVNMASTGCGKTLANARIFYALSDPRLGMRATYALGLRTLTLQTGRSYRNDLHLDEDELALLVGGTASRALFEYYEAQAEETGSASSQALLEEDSHVLYEGQHADHPLLTRALANASIRKLLSAPILVCTVDHLVPATEAQRAGRQIAPLLRLMSGDLILDELDDYDLEDLPALTRLVYWAGLLGTRLILSSATLPPALVEGMFMAYREGRKHFMRNRGSSSGLSTAMPDIPCLWVDEFGTHTSFTKDSATFSEHHRQFIEARVAKLNKGEPLRKAEITPIIIQSNQREKVYEAYARTIRDGCWKLHLAHAETDPSTGKQVSFGIVRMANIEPLIQVAKKLYSLDAPKDAYIHLCVYHSRFPLVQRSAIENLLDRSFNRRDKLGQAVFQLPEIRKALEKNSAQHQMFVVLASPVCEVGRDWDADWAIAEPSSMRSLIQLAGRIQRHRRRTPNEPNMLLLDIPIKYYLRAKADRPVYIKPGFESDHPTRPFRLSTYWLHELLKPEEYQTPSAIPRIAPRPTNRRDHKISLTDLEQARMEASMLPGGPIVRDSRGRLNRPADLGRDEAAPGWEYARTMLTAILQQAQPFRDSSDIRTTNLVFLPDEEESRLVLHRIEDNHSSYSKKLYIPVEDSLCQTFPLNKGDRIGNWAEFDLIDLLREHSESLNIPLRHCAEKLATAEVTASEQGWNWNPQTGFSIKH